MLLSYSFENYKSFLSETTLNMRPAPRLKTHVDHVKVLSKRYKIKALRTALIFGANASGKSNLIDSILFAKRMITSAKNSTEEFIVEPFILTDNKKEDSSFFFEFFFRGTHFCYGFSVAKSMVVSEILYIMEGGDKIVIFDRNDYFNSHGELAHPDAEHGLNYLVKAIAAESNVLILNSLNNSFSKSLKDIFGSNARLISNAYFYFKDRLQVVTPDALYNGLTRDVVSESEEIKKIPEYDTGISSVSFKETNKHPFTNDRLEEIRTDLLENGGTTAVRSHGEDYLFRLVNGELNISALSFSYQNKNGNVYELPYVAQSDGTKRLLNLLPLLRNDFEGSEMTTVICDEFDRSMHPLLAVQLFKDYLAKEHSPIQLIATTHSSELLNTKLIRRDEVWFVQKNWDMTSMLYSLDDYEPRFDKDISSAYLSGIYGAVPYFKKGNF